MPNFKKFVHAYCTQIPVVSGHAKNGRFSFNQAAVRQYGLSAKEHCDLYFDEEERLIGFVFIDEPNIGSVKVKCYKYDLNVAASHFCNHYKIDLDSIKKREIKNMEGMLVIKA